MSKTLYRSSPGLGGLYPDNAFAKNVHKRRAVEDKIKIRDSYSFIGKDMSRHASHTTTCLKMMVRNKLCCCTVRLHQEWKDNYWIFNAKDSRICEDMFSRMLKKAQMRRKADVSATQEVLEPDLKSKTVKTSSPSPSCLYSDDAFAKSVHKRRAIEDEIEIRDSYSFIGKVENSSYQRENWGKVCGQTHTKKFTYANSRNHDVVEFLARSLEPDDCVSTMSSVSSGSTIYNVISDRLNSHSSSSCSQHSNSLRSDVESCQQLGVEEELAARHSKEDYALRNHGIELSTYRSTLDSFYACGPLS